MLTQGRGVRWHLPFRPVGLALIFCLRGGGGISRHAFPLIGPPPSPATAGRQIFYANFSISLLTIR
nr:MAG TPA: hypothetical protein [Caudoviricetes sp.]DAZ58493.1 MAG TPA: hypothetical protein [Caudoviricetes sp.]